MTIKKKGQEEVVGFVLIVVIISVIALVFLGITIRQGGSSAKNTAQVSQFLDSAILYTTNCTISSQLDYANVGDLISRCRFRGSKCLSGMDICKSLNQSLNELLSASWMIGKDNPYKGYNFTAFDAVGNSIVSVTKGNCSYNRQGADRPYPENISIQFFLCS